MNGNKWQLAATIATAVGAVVALAGAVCQTKANTLEIDAAVAKRFAELNKPNNKQASDKALITKCLITCSEHNLIYLEGDN